MSISKKWSLVSLEPLDPNSEKVEGFYKAKKKILMILNLGLPYLLSVI